MSRPAFVAVEGGKLHRNPAYEDCNIDDAAVVNRFASLDDVPKRYRNDPCSKCEPLGELKRRVGKKRVYPVGGGGTEEPPEDKEGQEPELGAQPDA